METLVQYHLELHYLKLEAAIICIATQDYHTSADIAQSILFTIIFIITKADCLKWLPAIYGQQLTFILNVDSNNLCYSHPDFAQPCSVCIMYAACMYMPPRLLCAMNCCHLTWCACLQPTHLNHCVSHAPTTDSCWTQSCTLQEPIATPILVHSHLPS